jgi:hypothetical protein
MDQINQFNFESVTKAVKFGRDLNMQNIILEGYALEIVHVR